MPGVERKTVMAVDEAKRTGRLKRVG